MDLSGLKWPIIIVVLLALGWLGSIGGVNWMYDRFTEATPGIDPEQDKIDEEGLSKLAGYLLYLWQYDRAATVLEAAIQRYGPSGANYWYNKYRLAKCYEKMEMYQASYDLLRELESANAHSIDDRVANNDNLRLRAMKLKEVQELE